MKVKITVAYPHYPEMNYTVECSAEEAAAREPWAAAVISQPEFESVSAEFGPVVKIERIAGA